MHREQVCKNVMRSSDGYYLIIGSFAYGRRVLTKEGIKREAERDAFNACYDNDELYARHIRSTENRRKPNSFEIFDELPDGWTTHLSEHGEVGLRGYNDHTSKYVWCENMPMYVCINDRYKRNPGYRQSLVRRH